ncbi:ATP-binding cassette domain-containing protein [Actinoallomurus vinaceus]|uniref:ATP-binding cassette domain-containing protein n=1 Tax=Actinoallomurus vinaceus TaxID=1080074 RepID=A0ABP8UGE5_9ACTN
MSLRDGAAARADGAPATPADGALVRCVNVARTFGTGPTAVVAVHDVSCTVPSGARVALMGPSGSGKSTLLHLIAGLDAPTGGTIAWPGLGAGPNGRPGPIGVIFQGPSLIPTLDVTENVALPLLFAGIPAQDAAARASAALDRVGIADLGPKLPEELSGGQAQRAAVARVIAGRPRLILADEPTGQLDHETGGHVISVLLTAAEELGAALIVTTHDAQIAARLPHRWTMRDGGLATRGAGPGDDRRP